MTRKIILGGHWIWDDDQYPDPYESYGEASASDDDDDADAAEAAEAATLEEWLQWNYADVTEDHPDFQEYLTEALEHYLEQGWIPALCQENCSIELDGHCSHGHPSPFVELGLI